MQSLTASPDSGFQNCLILNSFCSNALLIVVLILKIVWITEFSRQNFWHTLDFFFSILYLCITLTFPLMLQTFLFMNVAMLLCYQSPINCRSRNTEGNFIHNVNYCYYCCFQAWNLCSYLTALRACLLKNEAVVEFSNFPISWIIIVEPMTGNVFTSKVDALMLY